MNFSIDKNDPRLFDKVLLKQRIVELLTFTFRLHELSPRFLR